MGHGEVLLPRGQSRLSEKWEKRDDYSGRYPRGGQHGHLARGRRSPQSGVCKFLFELSNFQTRRRKLVSIVCENVNLAKMKSTVTVGKSEGHTAAEMRSSERRTDQSMR